METSKHHKPHSRSRFINMPSIPPPPLTPAPHLIKKKLYSSPDPHHNTSASQIPSAKNSQHEADGNKNLLDAHLEIECLKSTLVATNEMLSSNEEEMKRLEAKSVDLELKLTEEKSRREKLMVELVRLQTLLAESAKIQAAHHNEIMILEAEVNRLRAVSVQHPVALDYSAVEMPSKKRKKTLHKCSHCGYSTFRENAMKIHREEGCRSAVVDKLFSCDVCNGKFTYNTYRYHLNQYAKKSSHAKNGHQNHTPAQHRQMLEKLKQTKQ